MAPFPSTPPRRKPPPIRVPSETSSTSLCSGSRPVSNPKTPRAVPGKLVAERLAAFEQTTADHEKLKNSKNLLAFEARRPQSVNWENIQNPRRKPSATGVLTTDLAHTRAFLYDSDDDESSPTKPCEARPDSFEQYYPQALFSSRHGGPPSPWNEPESPLVLPPPPSHVSFLSRRPRYTAAMAVSRAAQHAEESAEVEVLLAQAKKHDDLGKKIKASLGRIQETAASLESAVGPAYSDTQSLQTFNENVDKLLTAIARMQTPLEGKADDERVIRDGPDPIGLQAYLATLRRVEGKFQQLNSQPMRVNQEAQNELSQLLKYGAKKLQEKFDKRIQEDARPVEPLQYTTKNAPFPQISGPKVAELRELSSFISSTQPRAGANLPTVQMYQQIRGNYLQASLQNMATGSTNIPKKKETGELYRQGESTINIYAQGIEGMFKAEWNNVCSIFPRDETGLVFELTTNKALTQYSRTLQDLNSQIKVTITSDCFLAFEMVEINTNLAIQLDTVTGQLKQQVRDLSKPIRDTATKSLVDLIEDIRRSVSGLASMPNDGCAIAVTTKVLKRLQNLINFRETVVSSMASLGDHGWMQNQSSSRSYDVSPNSDELLQSYILDSLETLFTSLEQKAQGFYKDRSKAGIFLANNVAIAERMIRTSDLNNLVYMNQQASRLEGFRKKGITAYVDAWREPCTHLRDAQHTSSIKNRPTSGGPIDSTTLVKGMSSKEKDAYKEKFQKFNSSFDMAVSNHKALQPGMDRDIRNLVAREVGSMIEPMYARFWDRYHEIDKGKGKYVKWDKSSLNTQIQGLGSG